MKIEQRDTEASSGKQIGSSGQPAFLTADRFTRIPPSSGVAFELDAGDRLEVVDPLGEQVSDMICFVRDDLGEYLSSGRTIDYESTIRLTTGHRLWSNRSRVMMQIEDDTCGTHDFLLTPCSAEMYRILYGEENHPSCLSNIAGSLRPWGVVSDDIATTFNIFMNVPVRPDGTISVDPPVSRPGDRIVFRAELDLVVALTACASESTNNGSLKPIDYRVIAGGVA